MNDELEAMVDELGLYGVLDALQEIAYAKAEHLDMDSNWQDHNAARAWTKCASLLSSLEFKISKLLPRREPLRNKEYENGTKALD
jgi:hypothetical protein